MKKPGKLILKVCVGLLILFIATVFVIGLAINGIARAGIEKGATYALGVDTTLKAANVSILSGTFSMSGLNVANPKGYKGAHFLILGEGGVAVSLGSLLSSTVELPSLTMTDLSVSLEKEGGTANYQVILDNLAKLSGPPKDDEEKAKRGGKKFVIKEVVLKNIKIHAELVGATGAPVVSDVLHKATSADIVIDEIRLKNVGQSGVANSGATMGEIAALIVKAVLSAAASKGGGILPADLLNDLKGNLDKLGGLGNVVMELGPAAVKDATKAIEGIGNEGKKTIEEGKKAVEGIGEGIKGILPGGGKP